VQLYEETTEPRSTVRELAEDVLLGPIGRSIQAGVCLSNLEQPMIDLTFNRWIPSVCRRTASGTLHSREWDAFGHCWIGCEGSRRCGSIPTALTGTVREFSRELQRVLKIRPHDSFRQDRANQALGRSLADTRGTCWNLCDAAHRGGTLDVSAPEGTCIDCNHIGSGEVPCR
jgi:hypothetical protein